MTGIEALADLLVSVGPESVSSRLLHDARRCLLDALGCGTYGASLPEGRVAIAALTRMCGTGQHPGLGLPVDTAALAGGFSLPSS